MSVCPDPAVTQGVVRNVLATVDCHVQTFSEAGYLALTGPRSFFPAALTILLTLYVAMLGIRLMFGVGSARLADAPLIAVKIGVILAMTLNWTAFQTLVFDLTQRAPIEVAGVVAAPAVNSGSSLAASPLDGLQTVYDELGLDAEAFGKAAGPNPQVLQGGQAAVANGLWRAQDALFMSTAGIIAITAIALGVLVAIGPIFIALFLFRETRGLFAGWLRATLAVSLAPMFCWITTAVLLVAIDPWVTELARGRTGGALDEQTAKTLTAVVFIFATAQGVLAFGAVVIASGFQLNFSRPARKAAAASQSPQVVAETFSRVERLALQLQQSNAARWSAAGGGSVAAPSAAGAPAMVNASVRAGDLRAAAPPAAETYRREAHLDRFRKPDRSQ